MHECWVAGWGDVDRNFSAVIYLLGYVPGTHRSRQLMVAGRNGYRIYTIELPQYPGQAHISGLGRRCAVITYGASAHAVYYRPATNQFVRFCRWRKPKH